MRLASLLVFSMVLLFLGACAGGGESPPEPEFVQPAARNRMSPEHAPTPFSAEEIRRSCGPRHRIRMLEQVKDKPKIFKVFYFTEGDTEGAKLQVRVEDGSGKLMAQSPKAAVTWKALQSHASFPAIHTRISEESLTTPLGTFACWRYDVSMKKEGKPLLRRFWFAKKLPGPPVRLIEIYDGAQISSLEILEHAPME